MSANIENFGYKISWESFQVDRYEGYYPNMSDYHMHEYYEISLILSGSVKVLLPNSVQDSTKCRLVLTRPLTPHLIVCEPQLLYKRVNLLFSPDFISEYMPEHKEMLGIFGKNGRVLTLSEEQCERFVSLIELFENEKNEFRKRLVLMYLLSLAADIYVPEKDKAEEPPQFVSEALSYIQENCSKKILADDLAWRLGIGRTTLMTAFKKYTGSTLGGYITDCRLKQAIKRLYKGELQSSVAENCGFGDACNMIRAFRRRFGITPGQYVKEANDLLFSRKK